MSAPGSGRTGQRPLRGRRRSTRLRRPLPLLSLIGASTRSGDVQPPGELGRIIGPDEAFEPIAGLAASPGQEHRERHAHAQRRAHDVLGDGQSGEDRGHAVRVLRRLPPDVGPHRAHAEPQRAGGRAASSRTRPRGAGRGPNTRNPPGHVSTGSRVHPGRTQRSGAGRSRRQDDRSHRGRCGGGVDR